MAAAVSGVTPDNAPASASTLPLNGMANTDTFLKLLVAQIQNQDPLNPSDSMQFVTQLAQFSQLEQTIGIRTDVAALRKDVEPAAPATTSPQP